MSERLTDADLAAIRARHEAATPGPYRWYGYGGRERKEIDVHLATTHSGRIFVMGFERSGMRGAAPTFQVRSGGNGVITSVREMIRYERAYRDNIEDIEHPDAIALSRSWEDVDFLLREVDRLRAACEKREAAS